MRRYRNRERAGKILARRLRLLTTSKSLPPTVLQRETVVFALPRGGVPLGFEIACALGIPLDILVVKKVTHASDPEFAIGANSEDQDPELRQIAQRLRQGRERHAIKNRNIILVDDGMATGHTMKLAIEVIRNHGAAHVLVAVPVAPPSAIRKIEKQVDMVISPIKPAIFVSVGGWYQDFGEVTDRDVISILESLEQGPVIGVSF